MISTQRTKRCGLIFIPLNLLVPLKLSLFAAVTLLFSEIVRSESVLDVLVLYTNNVESYYDDSDGVKAHVAASFASANLGFENSNVAIRLKLKAIEKIDYEEAVEEMGDDLDFIAESEFVANLRNKVGADLVCLFRHGWTGDAAGIAQLLNDASGEPNRGFSVVMAQAAISSLTFHHEVGHNLGGAHDRENSDTGGLYPYSYGYRFDGSNGTEYRTIMAYAPGREINLFSNPEVLYSGSATGVSQGEFAADNARTFNETNAIVDSYRAHLHLNPIANAGMDFEVEDLDRDGVETIQLDGADSIAEVISLWEWTWPGGSSSGSVVNIVLPIGSTEVSLRIVDDEGFVSEDRVTVSVKEYSFTTSVEAGARTGYFLKDNGDVYGFGKNDFGQLGITENSLEEPDPTLVVLKGIESMSSGEGFSLFKGEDGSVWALGDNGFGQLGDGSVELRKTPSLVFESGVDGVSAGGHRSLFLLEDGSLWTSGRNEGGRLGVGTNVDTSIPVRMVDSGVRSMSAGSYHSAWVASDGSLWTVGLG